jgi:hypothetical protein
MEFYSIKSNLLLRRVETMSMGENSTTQTSTYSDYQAVDGIMVPFKIALEGMMPMPLEAKMTSVQFNVPINDADFSVE